MQICPQTRWPEKDGKEMMETFNMQEQIQPKK